MKERIQQAIQMLDISVAEFERTCGLSNGAVSAMSDNTRMSTLEKITKAYPQININWLRTGNGEMLNNNRFLSKFQDEDEKPKGKDIPLLPINAIGGTLDGFNGGVMPYECEWINVPLKAADMAITVAGDSMYPKYPSGSIVIVKKIDEKAFIEWGCVYVLDTVNGSVIKKVRPCKEDEAFIICESFNELYNPFKVALTDIRGFYKVLVTLIRE